MRPRVSALIAPFAPVLLLAACLMLATPAPARADSPYVQGLELYRQGKYEEAARILRAALPKPAAPSPDAAAAPPAIPSLTQQATLPAPTPATPPADAQEPPHIRAVLGFTLLRLNHLSAAEEQFDFVRRDPVMGPVGVLGAGWAAYARGKTSAAVQLFNEAIAKMAPQAGVEPLPDMLRESVPTDARLALGLIALGRGAPQEALGPLQAAMGGQDVLGSPKELLIALGDARAQTNNPRGAVDAWAEVQRRVSRFPGDAPRDELARLKTARLQETGGMAEAALAGYAELGGGKYYRGEALQGQARTLLAQGRAAEALPVLRRLVNEDPNMADPLEAKIKGDPLLRPVLKDWGLAYFHRADYQDSLAKLSGYLDDVDANDSACQLAIGWSHLRLGNPQRAWDVFSDAMQLKPQAAGPLVGMAASALALGRTEEARGLLSRALAVEPGNALALGTLGHLELSQGNTQKALDNFRAALKSRPDYVDSRLSVARILFDRAEYDAAAAEFFRLVTQEKRSTTGWNGLGWARLRLGQYDDALAAFAEARRQNPNMPVGAYGMGITLARQGKPDQASQRLAEAIFLNPDFAATPEVLELMRSRPEYSELFLEMGEAYARKLYPTTAAPYLEEYLRQNPNSRPGRRALAWASFWAGQEDKAHALFQTLITVNKDDPDAHLGDGLALLSRGHLDLAEPHLRDAVRLDPKNSLAWRALVLLLTRQGRDKEAVAAQREAPRSRLERLDRMSASGFTALSEGRMRDALSDFHRAVLLDPGLAAPHYGLAFTLVELGDPKQARDELLAGMNLDPAYLDEQELSQLLAQHSELNALAVDLSWSQLYALNLPAARTGFERILATSPTSMEALFGLGATAYLQADWALAESCFDKLLPRAPLTSPSWDKWCHLMDKLGWSAYHQQKYDKALHVFDWLRTFHPETPYASALGGMGWALLGKGQAEQAQNLFLRSLNIFPRNLTAMQGMTALKKAPETDDQDMDDEPEPVVRKSRKGSKAKLERAERAVREEMAEAAERPGKKSKKKSRKSKVQDEEQQEPKASKKSRKAKDEQEVQEPAVKKSKKAKAQDEADETPAKGGKSKKSKKRDGQEQQEPKAKGKKSKAAGDEPQEAKVSKKSKKAKAKDADVQEAKPAKAKAAKDAGGDEAKPAKKKHKKKKAEE
jgi:tetratricopeptide (TPR) repeat protein